MVYVKTKTSWKQIWNVLLLSSVYRLGISVFMVFFFFFPACIKSRLVIGAPPPQKLKPKQKKKNVRRPDEAHGGFSPVLLVSFLLDDDGDGQRDRDMWPASDPRTAAEFVHPGSRVTPIRLESTSNWFYGLRQGEHGLLYIYMCVYTWADGGVGDFGYTTLRRVYSSRIINIVTEPVENRLAVYHKTCTSRTRVRIRTRTHVITVVAIVTALPTPPVYTVS